MEASVEVVIINGIEYIKKDAVTKKEAEALSGMKYVIVRTYSAGVFAGYLKNRNGKEGELLNARRLWYWKGAASLSQLSQEGVSCPDECKFPCEVTSVSLTEIIEVLLCTEKARLSILEVAIWEK